VCFLKKGEGVGVFEEEVFVWGGGGGGEGYLINFSQIVVRYDQLFFTTICCNGQYAVLE